MSAHDGMSELKALEATLVERKTCENFEIDRFELNLGRGYESDVKL
jgi:hypothetical protein